MAAPVYIAYAADTSAATGPPTPIASSATANAVKTILQIKPGSSKIRVIEWGYTIDVVPGSPVKCELVAVNVAATVTTIGSGVRPYNDVAASTSGITAGVAATGFNASAVGTVTASRLLAYQFENGLYFKQQFPLGREPEIGTAEFLRVRVSPSTAGAVNIMPYVIWEE